VICLLDAGMKKSARGSELPRWQIDRLAARLRQAETHYRDNADSIGARFELRRQARRAVAMRGIVDKHEP